jgi:hypothetical protein
MTEGTPTTLTRQYSLDGKWKAMSDDEMVGPGAHENSAMDAVSRGHTEEAQIYAILALAAAVNRLANAQEANANT